MLLLHGLSQQSAFWDPVIRRMSGRPVAALDQRGHGASDTPLDADYSVAACASDVEVALDSLEWPRAVVIGHSWGGSVALAATARLGERVAGSGLVDGGLWSPLSLGPRDEVRERLRPPALGVTEDELRAMLRSGDLAQTWSDETWQALEPTFIADDEGRYATRLGMDRHMKVLDGLLDHDVQADILNVGVRGTPVWAVLCGPTPSEPQPGVDLARQFGNYVIHRWEGAVHDVPLQWPALVAGFVDALAEAEEIA